MEENQGKRSDLFNLQRFIDAQAGVYEQALKEIEAGKKESHWMWFIYPQMYGLGESLESRKYGIRSLEEAQAYLADPILGQRLEEITSKLLDVKDKTAFEIFGRTDTTKLRSSMTLFEMVSPPDSVFAKVLEKYFAGIRDPETIKLARRG